MERKTAAIIIAFLFLWVGCRSTIDSESENLFHSQQSFNPDGSISALIEIPMGTSEKWEYDKEKGAMDIEIRNGKKRRIKYLPYPVNYGMIPQTILPKEFGGDGDPLDVLVIGESIDQGSLVSATVLGVLKFKDRGEQDDKIVAISNQFNDITCKSLKDLQEHYPSIIAIFSTWFSNYKGPGKMIFEGSENEIIATELIQQAHSAYKIQYKNE